MTAKTFQIFNTLDEEGHPHQYKFDTYLDCDLPDPDIGCVYIFADTKSSGEKFSEYYHIHYVDRIGDVFDKTNIKSKLKKYHSNAILIYESTDLDEMSAIYRWIKASHDIEG